MPTGVRGVIHRIGGKFFLVNWLNQYIPEHTTYVEPFCGAGHLLFAKTPSRVEVVNDIDGHLIDFFRLIKDSEKRQKLIKELEYMPYSRLIWQMARNNWKQGTLPQDEIERVAQWYYLNRASFSGDHLRGGFAMPSITGRNPVQSFRNSIDTFEDVAERLRGVCVENLDYAECIRRYDSTETLFYCDPPYLGAEHYYGDTFTEQDHYRLSEILHSIKGKAMVSHYANEIYNGLYQGWNRVEFQSFKGSHKANAGESKPKTAEALYCSFELKKTRSLFQEC